MVSGNCRAGRGTGKFRPCESPDSVELFPLRKAPLMLPCSPASECPSRVDVRLMALAVPAPGLAPDALARFDRKPRRRMREPILPPYHWQLGETLYLLDRTVSGDWSIAEFRF